MAEGRKTRSRIFPFLMVAMVCALALALMPVTGASGGYHAAQLPTQWYMAEGSTAGGMQTFVLVLSPASDIQVSLHLMTGEGPVDPPELQNVVVPAQSRKTFHLNAFVTTYDVSTTVVATGECLCERAMYGPGGTWAHDSLAAESQALGWNMAEGSTAGGMETWLLVQNPNPADAHIYVTLMTGSGPVNPPELQGYLVPGNSRRSIDIGLYVQTFDVSMRVDCYDNSIICERAMYGPGRQWATESKGMSGIYPIGYLAEGSTAGGMETWVLVQNPQSNEQHVNLNLMTESGPVNPPELQGVAIPANSRRSFNLGDYVTTYNVSTVVTSAEGYGLLCERSMYGPGRVWAHNSICSFFRANTWFLAEGSTAGGMETWLLVQNPSGDPGDVSVTLFTEAGPVSPPGLQNVPINARSRISFNIGDYLDEASFGMVVGATQTVLVERAMYGNGRQWGTDSIGYPLTGP
jgi:hypothetical protein